MKYESERIIACPVAEVRTLFSSIERLPDWQDSLLKATPLVGRRDRPGAKLRLVYVIGRQRIEMTETLEITDKPDCFEATYRAEQAWHRMRCEFEDAGQGKTRWKIFNDFQCKGRARILTILLPGAFRRHTEAMMDAFQDFAENLQAQVQLV